MDGYYRVHHNDKHGVIVENMNHPLGLEEIARNEEEARQIRVHIAEVLCANYDGFELVNEMDIAIAHFHRRGGGLRVQVYSPQGEPLQMQI